MEIRVIYGEERFLVKREIKRFEKKAAEDGLAVVRKEEWSQETADAAAGGFINNSVIVHLQNIQPLLGCKVNTLLVENPILIVLMTEPTDAQAAKLGDTFKCTCFKKLSQEGAADYISAYAGSKGARITYSACDELIERTGYMLDNKVCLADIFSEMDKIIAINQDITQELVMAYTAKSLAYNVFELAGIIERKNRRKMYAFAEKLLAGKDLQSEAFKICGLLQKQYRIAFKAGLLPQGANVTKELGIKRVPVGMTSEAAYRGIELCARTVNAIKNGAATKQQLILLFEELMDVV